MSANIPENKLTVQDLDRFLSVQSEEVGIESYLRSAAVLAAFDPFQLNPDARGETLGPRERVLEQLLPQCEPITQGVNLGLWTLSLPSRRESLRQLETREQMRETLELNPSRSTSPVQRVFEQLLEPGPIELEGLTRDELASLLEVLDWLEGILLDLPDRAAVRQSLSRTDLLAPMERLAGHGFVGREKELAQLNDFVSDPKKDVPLFVFGPGGVGKSTLISRFVLTHAVPQNLAIVYLDIDRPIIRPEQPLTLCIEIIAQLQVQLDLPAGSAESLIKELTSSLARIDESQVFESPSAGSSGSWTLGLFTNQVASWLKDRTALLIIDTLEEAQFLGADVMWPLISFILDMNRESPLRIILSGRTLPSEYVSQAFPNISTHEQEEFERQALLQISYPLTPVNLEVLEQAPALELMRSSLEGTEAAGIENTDLEEIINLVGRNPMVLKLAARLLQEEGIDKLRSERSELFAKLKAEKIQALLYGRILRNLHDDEIRKVAYPGLLVRRIDPNVIRDVLAEPCDLKLTSDHNENHIFNALQNEAALVYLDPEDYSLRHRADVRRAMLDDLTDHVRPEVVEDINRRAIDFYHKFDGAIERAEEIYHMLRIGEPEDVLNSRWSDDAARYLQGALEEVSAEQRLWLAERLNVTLDASVRQAASQESWERQAVRSANRYLKARHPEDALHLLRERSTRSSRSPLYALEVETLRFLERPDEALKIGRAGVEAASKDGAIDMALELLLKMVAIEEARERLKDAWKLLEEAAAVATHSSNKILQLRVEAARLRLQRQLSPADRTERAELRQKVMSALDDETLRMLREYPVLLRELAAELAKQDPRLASAALETLGVEVGTDAQAKAFGNAFNKITADPKVKEIFVKEPLKLEWERLGVPTKVKGGKKRPAYTAEEIRKLATEVLTSRDTRKISEQLASTEAGSKILSSFREYFRVGVDSALKGKIKAL